MEDNERIMLHSVFIVHKRTFDLIVPSSSIVSLFREHGGSFRWALDTLMKYLQSRISTHLVQSSIQQHWLTYMNIVFELNSSINVLHNACYIIGFLKITLTCLNSSVKLALSNCTKLEELCTSVFITVAR